MSATSHPVAVTDDDVRFLDENGYFVYHHQLFPAESFAALKAFFEDLLANLPEGKRPEGMDVPHFEHPRLMDWLLAEPALDFVERFIGPDIALWSSHFICKPPGVGQVVPWHEDSAYWGDVLEPHEVVTVWLAIDDSQPENGCMRVIPGTHDNGFSAYQDVEDRTKSVFPTEVRPELIDESKAVDLAIRAGECHVHHAKTIHGSNANTSALRRCGYTMRYMPTTMKFHQSRQPNHAIYLARGVDRAGNDYADPTVQFVEGIR